MASRAPFILAFLLIFGGCGRSISRVTIPIQVDSEIDTDQFSNFAVLPFVKDKTKDESEQCGI